MPDVVTRYNVKFSIRSTTQEVIKLSIICLVNAVLAAKLLFTFELLSFGGVAWCGGVAGCGDRSNGGCADTRFGRYKSNKDSRNAFNDCCSQSAG